jgi:predicted O-methyltransferase YrrM
LDERWREVDEYLAGLLVGDDGPTVEGDLPPAEVSPLQGKLLHLLARVQGARTILELGTLGGYSTIWLARALPPDGRLVTLEANARYARAASANLERAGVGELVEIRVGPALETLPDLRGPFDLVFLDADKANNPAYLEAALELTRPGGLIVADNVVRDGGVDDATSADPSVQGVRRFFELLAADPRADATAIQTVGAKGWDGFALALRR